MNHSAQLQLGVFLVKVASQGGPTLPFNSVKDWWHTLSTQPISLSGSFDNVKNWWDKMDPQDKQRLIGRALPAAIGTVGGLAGGLASGSPFSGAATGLGIGAGLAAGAYGGNYLNDKLGITDPTVRSFLPVATSAFGAYLGGRGMNAVTGGSRRRHNDEDEV